MNNYDNFPGFSDDMQFCGVIKLNEILVSITIYLRHVFEIQTKSFTFFLMYSVKSNFLSAKFIYKKKKSKSFHMMNLQKSFAITISESNQNSHSEKLD